jgi:hypothetical protein
MTVQLDRPTGWGGARAGGGAPPKTLIELVRGRSFRPDRHVALFESDLSLLTWPALVPEEKAIVRLAELQWQWHREAVSNVRQRARIVAQFTTIVRQSDLAAFAELPAAELVWAEIASGRRRPRFVEWVEEADELRVAS